jgi:hypothetical protein
MEIGREVAISPTISKDVALSVTRLTVASPERQHTPIRFWLGGRNGVPHLGRADSAGPALTPPKGVDS